MKVGDLVKYKGSRLGAQAGIIVRVVLRNTPTRDKYIIEWLPPGPTATSELSANRLEIVSESTNGNKE